MKKFRGQKKYYKRLETENDLDKATWLNFNDPEIQLDNWHLHFDWKGFGNNSFKRRKTHLDKLIRHFEILEDETKKLQKDFQLYADLLDNDSYYDVLFVNTPNPNNKFPWKFEDLSASSNLTNTELDDYIKGLEGYERLYGIADENFCVIYKKGIGIEPK